MSTHRDLPPAPAEGGPWRLTLVTNPDDCNLACDMCECGAARERGGPRGAARRMETELAMAVLDERRGSALEEVIPSTMGEPLLWAGIDALLDRCAALGLAVNVTTNGTFPGRGAAAWAARLVPVASDVKISWNGATAATASAIMPGIDLDQAIANVATLAAARDAHARAGGRRAAITFQVTAQERNVGELAAIVRLAVRLGVDRVKLNHLQARRAELEPRSLRRSAAAIRRWNAAVQDARAAADAAALAGAPVRLENADALAEDPAEPAPRQPCRFAGREAWILHDGRFTPCPHPAAARGELGEFGSVADAPLGALWAAAPFRAFVARYAEHPICRACPLRRPGGA